MLNSTDRMANEKTEREATAKSARRAEEASIVSGLRLVLQPDEQLLGFARARIAGGIKGRLNIGPEAFFAPFVNIGLTERRFVIQHLHGETGKPSEILPHFFALADLQSIHFADIETYGGTPASRLVLHLANGQSFRLRLTGENNFASSKSLAEVFQSLTSVRKSASGPTQRVCISCRHIMDRPSKFCPYCGASQMDAETTASRPSESEPTSEEPTDGIQKVTVVVTEPHTDLLDDALAFLRNEPIEPSDTAYKPESESTGTLSNPSLEETIGTSTGSVTEPLANDTVVATEPIAGATDVADTPEASAEATNPVDTIEPITGAPTTEAGPSPDMRPAPAYTFPDFSSSSTWQAPQSPFAPVLSAEPMPTSEPTNKETALSETPASNEGSNASVQEAPVTSEEPPAPVSSFTPSTSTYSEAGSSASNTVPREEAPQMPGVSTSAAKPLRVHFHIKHPAVKFDEVITGRDADDVVSKLKDRVVSELKFPIKLAAMRLSPLEFAQEIVSKYNQEERQALPRPNSCREFLHLVQAIGYATVEAA